MGWRRIIFGLACCGVLTLSVVGSAAPAQTRPAANWGDSGLFVVEKTGGEYSQLLLSLDPDPERGFPAHVAITVPAGFELYADRPPADLVGHASVLAVDSAYGGSGTTLLEAVVVAGTLDAATEADAQACSPGKHVAVWYIKLSLLGEPLDVPIYLSTVSGESGQSKLDICVPSLPSKDAVSARTLPISSLRLLVDNFDVPKARELYVWRATVTPLAPDRRTALPQKAYELRAIVPQPHVLSLHGRYDRNAHIAVLQGRLSAAGKPRAGVRIYFTAMDRIIGADRIIFRDRAAGSVRTTAQGTFTFRKRIRKTTGFLAFVEAATSSCPRTVDPPGGCLSSTIAGTQSDPVTIGVPRK